MDASKVTPPSLYVSQILMPIEEVPIDPEVMAAVRGLDFSFVSGALRRCANGVSEG